MMKLIIIIMGTTVVIVALHQGAAQHCFDTICGNSNEVRGWDSCGSGSFGAPRRSNGKTWKHRGIDIKCPDGLVVHSPFQAQVVREAKADTSIAPYNTGILMQGTGPWSDYKVWMFYFPKSVSDGTLVNGGDKIGKMVDMTGKCSTPGMTNHIHVKLVKNGVLVDPTDYLCYKKAKFAKRGEKHGK